MTEVALEIKDGSRPQLARLIGLDPKWKFDRTFLEPRRVLREDFYNTRKLTARWTVEDGLYWYKIQDQWGDEVVAYLRVDGGTIEEITEAEALEHFGTATPTANEPEPEIFATVSGRHEPGEVVVLKSGHVGVVVRSRYHDDSENDGENAGYLSELRAATAEEAEAAKAKAREIELRKLEREAFEKLNYFNEYMGEDEGEIARRRSSYEAARARLDAAKK